MGIFTSNILSESTDIYSPTGEEMYYEGININFHEASLFAVAESTAMYNNTMKEIGIAELRYFEENGQEMIYEAVDVKAFFNKIKMFFKKLIDKVKNIFHTFIAKMSSIFSDNKSFISKYKNEFSRKWGDVKNDFQFTGYRFNIPTIEANDGVAIVKVYDNHKLKIVNSTGSDDDEIDLDKLIAGRKGTDALNTDTKDNTKSKGTDSADGIGIHTQISNKITELRDNREDICETIRGSVLNTLVKANVSEKLTAEEYSREMFEFFRGGESNKEKIDKSDFNVSDIVSNVSDFSKTKSNAEKLIRTVDKAIKQSIRDLERLEKTLQNEIPRETKDLKDHQKNYYTDCLQLVNEFLYFMRCEKEYLMQFQGAYLQALKDRVSQSKAIMVKVISGSKKMKEDYANESYYYNGSGSFLDSVVLK